MFIMSGQLIIRRERKDYRTENVTIDIFGILTVIFPSLI